MPETTTVQRKYEHQFALFREGFAVPTGRMDPKDPGGQLAFEQWGAQGWRAVGVYPLADGSIRVLFEREM